MASAIVSRRSFMGNVAGALTVTAVTATVPSTSKVLEPKPVKGRPHRSQKFNKPGWYAFNLGAGRPKVVQYAAYDGRRYLELSDWPGDPVNIGFSAAAFDHYCVGSCHRVSSDGYPVI